MRDITITLYKYNELPTDAAKERAREWWRACETRDPAWLCDHRNSLHAAIQRVKSVHRVADAEGEEAALSQWRSIVEESRLCQWTGYCGDCILYDNSRPDEYPSVDTVDMWYEHSWDKEMEHALSDDNVIENILGNDYEFHADGSIA